MSTVATQLEKTKGILSALDALTNRRAFVTLGVTLLGCTLIGVLLGYLASSLVMGDHLTLAVVFGVAGWIVNALLGLTGFSTTGFILQAQMAGRPQPSIRDALLRALVTLPRLLGVGVLLLLLLLGVALVVALLLLICKIPGVGPLLYAVVFPVCVIVTGVVAFSLLYITALSGPSVWNGNTTLQTIFLLVAIARQRLIAVVVQALLLGLLAAVVGGIVFGVLMLGMGFTGALSFSIIGDANGLLAPAFAQRGGMGMGGGGAEGYALVAMIAGMTLNVIGLLLPVLVSIAGYCLIYTSITEGLNTRDIEDRLRAARDKASDSLHQARLQMAAPAPAPEPAPEPPTVPPAAPPAATPPPEPPAAAPTPAPAPPALQDPPAAPACPACQQPVGEADAFCGHCGHKLK
jgi:hypothetical protein